MLKKFNMMLLITLGVCTMLQLVSQRVFAEAVTKLTFTIYATDKPADLLEQHKPVMSYLERELGKELKQTVQIRMKITDSYDTGRQYIVKGTADFARLGPASYVLARTENPKIKLLAIEEEDGGHLKKGVIFSRPNLNIKKIEDLRGKSFAFGDPDSTTGRYVSQAYLMDAGIYAKDLKNFEYLYRHDKVVAAVLAGKFDAGVVGEPIFEKYKDKGLVGIVTFDSITKAWVGAEKMDPTIANALKKVLLNMKDPQVLAGIDKKTTGFVHGDDSLYDPVKEAMKKADLFIAGPKSLTKK